MAKFYGVVGYGHQVEDPPGSGIHKDHIVERKLRGSVSRNSKRNVPGDNLNDDLTVNMSIRVLADAYAVEHFMRIKYVEWAGVRWTVTSVEVQRPRLLLNLGSVYNGPTP